MTSLKDLADSDFARLIVHVPADPLQKKTILVTGATGFFGAWLLSLFDWLNRTRHADIRVLAVSRDPRAFLERHPSFADELWLAWITGDVRDFSFPAHPVDYIIHAATDTSTEASKNPALLLDTIILGTRHVLACAKHCGAGRVLLVSSGAVYGAQSPNVTHIAEDTLTAPSPLAPANAYAEGKRVMEMLGAIYAQETGASVVMARCFAFVGAGLPLDGHFAIGNFIRDALKRDTVTVRGGGTAERSYLYAADLVIWLIRLLVLGQSGRAYNVGSDQTVTIAELARRVTETLSPNKPIVVEGKDDPKGGRNRYIPSIANARADCGVEVWTNLEDAIALTATYEA